jgi:hypothetical protein
MPLSTKLNCPSCGRPSQTTKAVSPGKKLRCPEGGFVFQFRASKSDRVQETPAGSIEPGPLRDLLADDGRATGVVRSGGAWKRDRGATNEPITLRSETHQPFSRNPLAPASERSKDRLIGGKPVRFTGPREFTAVVLMVAVMAVVYLCFWGTMT